MLEFNKSFFSIHRVFYLVLFCAVLFRLLFIIKTGLIQDELEVAIKSQTFQETFSHFFQYFNSIFFHLLVNTWTFLFGNSDWSLRSLALLFFIIHAVLIYRIGFNYLGKFAGLFSVIGLAFTEFGLFSSAFCLPVISSFTGVLMMVNWCLKVKHNNYDKVNWYFPFFAITIGMLSHYMAFLSLIVITIGIFSQAYSKVSKATKVGFFALTFYLFFMFIPYLLNVFHSEGDSEYFEFALPEWHFIFGFFFKGFNSSYFLVLFFLFAGLYSLYWFRFSQFKDALRFCLLVFTFTFLHGIIVSLFNPKAPVELMVIFSFPMLLPFAGSFLDRWKPKVVGLWLFGISLLLLFHSIFIRKVFSPLHYPEFKKIAWDISYYQKKYSLHQPTHLWNVGTPEYFAYYLKSPIKPALTSLRTFNTVFPLNYVVANSASQSLIYASSNLYNHPILMEVIRLYYPRVLESKQYVKGATHVFTREENHKRKYKHIFKLNNHKFQDSTIVYREKNQLFFKLKVSQIRSFIKLNNYVLFQINGKLSSTEAVKIKVSNRLSGNKSFFKDLNQSQLFEINKVSSLFLAFEIPKSLRNSEVLYFELENKTQQSLCLFEPKLFIVDPLTE